MVADSHHRRSGGLDLADRAGRIRGSAVYLLAFLSRAIFTESDVRVINP